MPDGGNAVPGEHLGEVTITLRAKFRNYLQAVVEKLAENTRAQSATKLKIIQDSKDVVVESDIRNRMQPLKDQRIQAINHLHTIFEVHVFVAICRGFWDRMGQDVLNFLENRKENRSWYKGSRVSCLYWMTHLHRRCNNCSETRCKRGTWSPQIWSPQIPSRKLVPCFAKMLRIIKTLIFTTRLCAYGAFDPQFINLWSLKGCVGSLLNYYSVNLSADDKTARRVSILKSQFVQLLRRRGSIIWLEKKNRWKTF